MHGTVPEKNTLTRAKVEFSVVVRPKIRPASTSESTKESVVWFFIQKTRDRCGIFEHTCGHTINEVACSEEGLIPDE